MDFIPIKVHLVPFQPQDFTAPGPGNQHQMNKDWPVDWSLYKERHLVESFFQKLKWFRRIATRYDKLDASFLAFVYIAAIAILLI